MTMPRLAGEVDHVERQHRAGATREQLRHEHEVASEIARVDDDDHRVGRGLAAARRARWWRCAPRARRGRGRRRPADRARRGRADAGASARPRAHAVVVPGKFDVLARAPQSALKSVVLPVLGLPIRAMRRTGAAVSDGSTSGSAAAVDIRPTYRRRPSGTTYRHRPPRSTDRYASPAPARCTGRRPCTGAAGTVVRPSERSTPRDAASRTSYNVATPPTGTEVSGTAGAGRRARAGESGTASG